MQKLTAELQPKKQLNAELEDAKPLTSDMKINTKIVSVTDHPHLMHLGYEESGHTGFASSKQLEQEIADRKASIEALDIESEDEDKKYVKNIYQEDGLIHITKESFDDVISYENTKTAPITSAIKQYADINLNSAILEERTAREQHDAELEAKITNDCEALSEKLLNKADKDHTHDIVTDSKPGFMSAADKISLDVIKTLLDDESGDPEKTIERIKTLLQVVDEYPENLERAHQYAVEATNAALDASSSSVKAEQAAGNAQKINDKTIELINNKFWWGTLEEYNALPEIYEGTFYFIQYQ